MDGFPLGQCSGPQFSGVEWLKKNLPRSAEVKRRCVETDHESLSVSRQCQLLGLARSNWYHVPQGESADNLALMRAIDELSTKRPFNGSRTVCKHLGINRKRAQRLMRLLGLEAEYPKRSTSRPSPGHKVFPSLLRNLEISRPNHVWASDITSIPMQHGFLYLTAVMDLFSRNVLSWRLSNTLTGAFCVEALDAASSRATPEIFNTDQGAQFTATAFTSRLVESGVAVSMHERGRALDNVFFERLWRTVKEEEVYLREYTDGWQAEESLGSYIDYYCNKRRHKSLKYRTHAEVYSSGWGERNVRAQVSAETDSAEDKLHKSRPDHRPVAARDPLRRSHGPQTEWRSTLVKAEICPTIGVHLEGN